MRGKANFAFVEGPCGMFILDSEGSCVALLDASSNAHNTSGRFC